MTLMERIHKQLGPYMKEKGFLRKGRYYYQIIGDIAYCIGFDNSPGSVYAYFFVMPLFIRSDFIYITYGERLNVLFRDRMPALDKTSGDGEISAWAETVTALLDDYVFPFFRQMDSPERLLSLLARDRNRRNAYIFCPLLDAIRLKMYTLLYLHRKAEARAAIEEYRAELGRVTYLTDRMIKHCHEEANALMDMLAAEDGEIDAWFEETVRFTKENCFSRKR